MNDREWRIPGKSAFVHYEVIQKTLRSSLAVRPSTLQQCPFLHPFHSKKIISQMPTLHEKTAHREMTSWQKMVQRKPSLPNRVAVFAQQRWNRIIPEKVHHGITLVIEKMVKGVLFGARHTTFKPKLGRSF